MALEKVFAWFVRFCRLWVGGKFDVSAWFVRTGVKTEYEVLRRDERKQHHEEK